MADNRNKSGGDEKETPAQKFFRQREEKRKKREKREAKRKARLQKPRDMKRSFPQTPGIYKLINQRTGEVFVSYSQNMANGISNHLFRLKINDHNNPDLQEDYNNGDRFDVVILREYMDYNRDELMEDTKSFIELEDSYYHGYNRHIGGTFDPKAYNHPGGRLDGSSIVRRFD